MIYDLDGTLVRLDVDWDVVAGEVAATLRDRGVDPPDELWEMLSYADEVGHRDAVERVISAHEREGARNSNRLRSADDLPLDVPVAVCSLNAESAVRVALETHDIQEFVGPVVGRDSGPERKPAPDGLLAIADALGVSPERTLFVGDGERDELTAERAGTAFRWV